MLKFDLSPIYQWSSSPSLLCPYPNLGHTAITCGCTEGPHSHEPREPMLERRAKYYSFLGPAALSWSRCIPGLSEFAGQSVSYEKLTRMRDVPPVQLRVVREIALRSGKSFYSPFVRSHSQVIRAGPSVFGVGAQENFRCRANVKQTHRI